jgi:hypothetical protein
MEKLQMKNTWLTRSNLIVGFLFFAIIQQMNAQQNTFKYVQNGYILSDILEDEKNGYLIVDNGDYNLFRISKYGELIWQQKDYYMVSIIDCDEFKDSFVLFGYASDAGGIAIETYDYKGNLARKLMRDPYYENNVSRSLWDMYYNSINKEYIAVGNKSKVGDWNLEFWISAFDLNFNIKWEKTWADKGQSRYFQRIFPIKNPGGGYLMLGTDIFNSEYWDITTTDSLGNFKTRHYVDGHWNYGRWDYSVDLIDMAPYKDSLFLLSVYQSSPQREFSYFVVNQQGVRVQQIRNKPVWKHHLPLKNGNILLSDGDFLAMLDSNFNFIWKREKIFGNYPNHDITIAKIKQSKDGGFYGIANGHSKFNIDSDSDLVFAFKTDTLGLIYENKPVKTEWDAPMMLQPNPAKNKVRIAIPYYYGTIEASFYNIQGQFIESQILVESGFFDISRLSPGIYFVKGRNIETNETRTMKLVVK